MTISRTLLEVITSAAAGRLPQLGLSGKLSDWTRRRSIVVLYKNGMGWVEGTGHRDRHPHKCYCTMSPGLKHTFQRLVCQCVSTKEEITTLAFCRGASVCHDLLFLFTCLLPPLTPGSCSTPLLWRPQRGPILQSVKQQIAPPHFQFGNTCLGGPTQ